MDFAPVPRNAVGTSPYGPADEIGRLNLITPDSRQRVLSRIDPAQIYDLSVDYFMGMPTWVAAGDPTYQIWMSHTPPGTVIDNLTGQTREINQQIGYSGDVFSMYSHCGTHIDTLNHWGYHGEIWNHFTASQHLGSRHWTKCGADKWPPIIARGVMLDVAATKGVAMLPDSYPITPEDLQATLDRQHVRLEEGDVVLIRTGRMTVWDEPQKFLMNGPGINVARRPVAGRGPWRDDRRRRSGDRRVPAGDRRARAFPAGAPLSVRRAGGADDGDRVPGGAGARSGLRVRLLRRAPAPARRHRLADAPLGDAAASVGLFSLRQDTLCGNVSPLVEPLAGAQEFRHFQAGGRPPCPAGTDSKTLSNPDFSNPKARWIGGGAGEKVVGVGEERPWTPLGDEFSDERKRAPGVVRSWICRDGQKAARFR